VKARANGIEIGYDAEGHGPWLVLCHSLGLDRSMWFQQVPVFARSHRVLAWDARGHGETTSTPGPYDFDLMARDLAALLDTLRVDRVAVLGLSMGGNIAMAFASTFQDRVSALILSDTIASYDPDARRGWRERIAAVKRDGVASLAPIQAERWFTDGFRASHPEVVERILNLLRHTDQQGYIAVMEALADLNLLPRLSSVRCPTLVIVGDEDPTTPPSAAEQIHQAIQGSKLVVLEHARHLSPIEQPEAFSRAVLEFLAEVGG